MDKRYKDVYDDDLTDSDPEVILPHRAGTLKNTSRFNRSSQKSHSSFSRQQKTPLTQRRANSDVFSYEANRAAFDERYGENPYQKKDAAPQSKKATLYRSHPVRESFDTPRQSYRASSYDEAAFDEPAQPVRRRLRKKRKHRVRNIFLLFIGLLVLAYVLIALPIDKKIAFEGQEQAKLSSELSFRIPGAPYYMLLLGSDARPEDSISRTDSMIVMRVDPLKNTYTMISIPRDTQVVIPSQGKQKINSAYAFGGVSQAVASVEDLLDISISEVALIHFDGIEKMVDALGGIDVNVPVAVNDPEKTGLVLPAGPQHMDGRTALLFSRVRYGFQLGDFQRQIDQRLVLEAMIAKARSLPPWDLLRVINESGDLVDTTLRCYNLFPLLLRMAFGAPTIYQASLPSTVGTEDGVSYVYADKEKMMQMMQRVEAGQNPA